MFAVEVRPVLSQMAFLSAVGPLLMARNKSESAHRVMALLEKRSKVGRRRKVLISQIQPATNEPR
jgi:hypothetical protein